MKISGNQIVHKPFSLCRCISAKEQRRNGRIRIRTPLYNPSKLTHLALTINGRSHHKKRHNWALASVAQLVGASSHTPKGRMFDPWWGHIWGASNPSMFPLHLCLSVCLSLSPLPHTYPMCVCLLSSLSKISKYPWVRIFFKRLHLDSYLRLY